ncbi:jg3860 [Pararge aegeria aegeria]|uniref:Jg3860 protein n=1 Tax=Pararge aegeria aegeria TaxID=348720 RepID=A0A8S4S016_9NEOP|nr:jg3860 [Pararge aegeria aegeria]
MNGPNQLGAVSDPSKGKRAARALSEETRKLGSREKRGGAVDWGTGARGTRVRAARACIDRAGPARHAVQSARGGRQERACDALPLTWPALGRSWPPAAAGGG